jgi:hypothetical protein
MKLVLILYSAMAFASGNFFPLGKEAANTTYVNQNECEAIEEFRCLSMNPWLSEDPEWLETEDIFEKVMRPKLDEVGMPVVDENGETILEEVEEFVTRKISIDQVKKSEALARRQAALEEAESKRDEKLALRQKVLGYLKRGDIGQEIKDLILLLVGDDENDNR